MHTVNNPGQTLDGIITQLIDIWEKQKQQEAVGVAGWKKDNTKRNKYGDGGVTITYCYYSTGLTQFLRKEAGERIGSIFSKLIKHNGGENG